MSFILDALKKSETDRQRQTGPALFEVKVAPPKPGFPVWAIAIVALLAINMVIVGWLLVRRSSKSDEAATQNASPVVSQPASTQAVQQVPAGQPPQQAYTQQQGYAPNQNGGGQQGYSSGQSGGAGQQSYPPNQNGGGQQVYSSGQGGGAGQQGFAPNQNGGGQGYAPAQNAGAGQQAPNQNGGAGYSPPSDGNLPQRPRAATDEPTLASTNPDDDVPAQDPGSSLFKGHVKRGTESGLMLYQDVAVTNGANLPELRLDMHVYDPKPQNRFALINMQKVTEGQIMKGDVRVEQILPEGVVMSHNGTKFLLPRE